MTLYFMEYFKRYETIVGEADAAFKSVCNNTGDSVRCKATCSDCCYALFDLTLVEALYLNHQFNNIYFGLGRSIILERADEADRVSYRLKREMFKANQEGSSTEDILFKAAKARVRCPLLNDNCLCDLYSFRPITCRIYGVPTAIGGQAYSCRYSGFDPGGRYPTVFMDKLQDRLYLLSQELAGSLKTRYSKLGSMLVPVSMALITVYDEEYMGLVETASKSESWMNFVANSQQIPAKMLKCSSCDWNKEEISACDYCKVSSIAIGGPDKNVKDGKED